MRNQYQKELNGIHRCVEISQHTTINIGSVKITSWMEYIWEKKNRNKTTQSLWDTMTSALNKNEEL